MDTKTETQTTETQTTETQTIKVTTPIIIDLGRKKRRRIKALKRGEGPLMDEAMEVIDDIGVSLGDDAKDKVLVPVILVYSKSRNSRSRRSNLCDL